MKMIIACTIVGLTTSAAVPARAQDVSGTVLRTACAEAPDTPLGRFCLGYVDGYMSGFRNGVAAVTVGAKICMPNNLTVGDWLAVVRNYLSDVSNDLNKPADTIVGYALYGAYRCKQ